MDPILEPGMYRRAPKAIERFFPKNRVLSRAGVHADGSCFFHSLSVALNLDHYDRHSDESRRKIGHNLRRRLEAKLVHDGEESWRAFWRSYGVVGKLPDIKDMRHRIRNIKTWADIWAIRWTMDQLKVNVIFFDLVEGGDIYCGVENFGWPNTVMIVWIDHQHFEPLVEMRDGEPPSFVFASTDPLIKMLRRKYLNSCSNFRLSDVAVCDSEKLVCK